MWLTALGWFKKLAGNPAIVLSIVALVAVVMLVISKNAEIHSLERQINAPNTGYIARIQLAAEANATLRGNNARLSTGLREQNSAITALGIKQENSTKAWAAAQGELASLHHSLAARMAAVDGAVAGPNKCLSALQLLKGAAQ